MTDVDDETLMAYLDGELDAAGRTRVEQALAADTGLGSRLEAQRRLRERLAARYDPVLREDVPERFREMLDAGVIDLGAARAKRARPLWQSLAAIAAALVLGIVLGRSLPSEGGPVGVDRGVLIAQGGLADALDTQLASAQPADAAARIGVSFARADGRLCRTFESAALTGLACRGDSGWQLLMTAAGAGPERGDYRRAGSGATLVLQAAQEMMAGEPLDAEAERRARDSGWSNLPPAR